MFLCLCGDKQIGAILSRRQQIFIRHIFVHIHGTKIHTHTHITKAKKIAIERKIGRAKRKRIIFENHQLLWWCWDLGHFFYFFLAEKHENFRSSEFGVRGHNQLHRYVSIFVQFVHLLSRYLALDFASIQFGKCESRKSDERQCP